jgi:hypothetical protein
MGRSQAQRHRTVRSSRKGTSAYRASFEKPGPKRAARTRRAVAAGRRKRRPLLLYVLVASVSAQIAAAFVGAGALLALFTIMGLLLSAVAIYREG